jgi:hypothetical protein
MAWLLGKLQAEAVPNGDYNVDNTAYEHEREQDVREESAQRRISAALEELARQLQRTRK